MDPRSALARPTLRLLAGLLLALATPAAAQVVDQGVVIVDPDDHLRIGVDAFGQRYVANASDGPYSAISIGEGSAGDGGLVIGANGDISSTGPVVVGAADARGRLQVLDGGRFHSTGAQLLGQFSTSTPSRTISAEVSGTGSSWFNTGLLELRDSTQLPAGSLNLSVVSGGFLETDDLIIRSAQLGTSTLAVDGQGSRLKTLGDFGTSGIRPTPVHVLNGAALEVAGRLSIANQLGGSPPTGPPTLLASGAGTTVTAGEFRHSGRGTSVLINSGAHVSANTIDLVTQTWTDTTVRGAGSRLTSSGNLLMGGANGGNPRLNVSQGARVEVDSAVLASDDSLGVTVSGIGSSFEVAHDLSIGGYQINVNVSNGATISAGDTTIQCASLFNEMSDCTISIDGAGSLLRSNGSMQLLANTEVESILSAQHGGKVDVAQDLLAGQGGAIQLAGGTVTAGAVDVQLGRISGSGVINAPVTNAGQIYVGVTDSSSIGLLTVTDAFEQTASGSISLELEDTATDSADQLSVTGQAIVAGILNVSALPSYIAELGDTFDLIVADDIVGQFDQVVLPALQSQLVWQLDYVLDPVGTDALRLRAVPEPGTALLVGLGLALTAARRQQRLF